MKSLQTVAVGLITLALATPVSALTVGMGGGADATASTSAGSVTISAAMQTRITTAKEHADKEIARRIDALTELNTRIQAMAKLTVGEKNSLSSSITTQVSAMTDLKTKIDADADMTTLKADIKSIAESYRIFLLVIPQGRITVAADRLKSTAEIELAFANKLSARIDADAAAGKDVTALKTTLADMQAKIADAVVQADAAISLVANLTPDDGDKTRAAANAQALKDARAKIKVAMQDEVTARADARTIVKGLTGNSNVNTSASTTTQ